MKGSISKVPLYIEIEGTDAVGKTSLLKAIERRIKLKFPSARVVCLSEFSKTPLGDTIRKIIDRKYFFTLTEGSRYYPISETIALIADYFARIESVVISDKSVPDIILSDRGVASILTYQYLRVTRQYPHLKNFYIKWISNIFSINKINILTVVLTSPEVDIKQRLTRRGDIVDDDSLKFIFKVQDKYKEIAKLNNYLVLENKNEELDKLVDKVILRVSFS